MLRNALAASLLLVLFFSAVGHGKHCSSCANNIIYPNACPSGELLDVSAQCGGDSCCPLATCCNPPSTAFCNLTTAGGGCCSFVESMCQNYGQIYISRRVSTNVYNSSCTTPAYRATWTCPANYVLQQIKDTINSGENTVYAGFCVADNCLNVSNSDCTKCYACYPGFAFVSDGSCQAYPSIQGSVLSSGQAISSLITAPDVLSLSTDPGLATSSVTIALTVTANGQQAWTGVDATISYGRCYVNGTAAAIGNFTGGFTSVVAPMKIGITVLSCITTDSNGLNYSTTKIINVTDNEPPRITCTSQTVYTGPSAAYAVYNWSRNATATDNVKLLGAVCWGGPGNNTFAANTTTNISCTAWDAKFNSTCWYTVTAVDNAPANITCPTGTISVNTTAGLSTGVATFAVTAADNVRVTKGPGCVVAGTTTVVSSGAQFAVGSTTVVCTAGDGANADAQCSFMVNVTDNEAPKIACPGMLTLVTGAAGGTAQAGTLLVNASDNAYLASVVCGTQPVTLSGSTLAGTATISNTFGLGLTNITCVARDQRGNNATCATSVLVKDTTAPVIVCGNSLLSTASNANYSLLAGGYAVSATDNVNISGAIACTPDNSNGLRQFGFGTTAVNCTAADAAGNVAWCALNVTVVDGQSPSVQCPLTTLAVPTNSTTNISVSLPLLNATDNVRVYNTSLVVVENQNSSLTTVYAGTARTVYVSQQWSAMVAYIATDSSGNVGTCSFGISVYQSGQTVDETAPVIINCPTNFTYSTIPSQDFNSPMYNASVYLYNITTQPNKRYGTVSWTALNATDNSGYVAAGYLEWSPNLVTAQSGLAAGKYVVAYGATDRQGNSAYCAFRIVVRDVEAPTWLRCSDNQAYVTDNNPGAYATSWPVGGMYAVDNVNILAPEGTCVSVPAGYCPQTVGQAPARMFPVGTVQFVYTAVDWAGNAAVPCRFNVTVSDNSPPVIPGCTDVSSAVLLTAPTSPGLDSADISRSCPLFSPTDNVGVTELVYESLPPGLNCSTPIPLHVGLAVLVVYARDAAGFTSFPCYIAVTVDDVERPVLSGCPSSSTVLTANCTPGQPTGLVTLPLITATDNSGWVNLSTSPAGYVGGRTYSFPTGFTSVTFTAIDAYPKHNPVECVVSIFVSDMEPPVISGFPGSPNTTYSLRLNTDPGQPTATYTIPNIAATDNAALTAFGFEPASFASGQTYALPIGSTVLRYSAQDPSFNQAMVTLTVVVEDHEKPVFSGCPSPNASSLTTLVFNTTEGLSTRVVSWNISVTDNSRRRVLTYQESHPVGLSKDSSFPIGTTSISYTAFDVSGNTQTCSFFVQILDKEPPFIQCPDNMTVTTATSTDTTAYVSWRDPITTDNSNVVPIVESSMSAGNYSLGVFNVTSVAVDTSGNSQSCTFFFHVVQAQSAAPPSSSGASTGAAIAGGAGGGIALLALLIIIVLVVMRRNHNKKMQAASSGYAELMAMSDEFVLERARAIQQALVDQRAADPPAAVNAQFIHPTRKFAAPPATLAELIAYIRETVRKEISRDSLEFGPELGSGEFGAVYRGEYSAVDMESGANSKQTVAIKMLKNSTSDGDKVRFLKEAAIMAQFNHPNIVSLVGVCTLPENEPTLIVLEYMHLGALHGYLQSPMVKDQLETLTMLRMALDIGSAMQYLAEAGFVHRDLAARNVLLDENMNCRVGDFGLSVDLATSNDEGEGGIYSGSEGAKIPVRWTSIEALTFRQFSSASDVWSFGVVLWEIWSYAEVPYKGWSNKRVTEQVCEGYRLPKPAQCPDEVYRLMIDCWNKNIKRRATFASINRTLVQLWKDTAREAHPTEGGAGNLYDVGDESETDAVLAAKQSKSKRGSGAATMALYDTGDEDGTGAATLQPTVSLFKKNEPASSAGTRATTANPLYDTGDDEGAGGATLVDSNQAMLMHSMQFVHSLGVLPQDVEDHEHHIADRAEARPAPRPEPRPVIYELASAAPLSSECDNEGGYLAVSDDEAAAPYDAE